MIIGTIETCSEGEIGGWIHSRSADLRGETVLAYLDGICVGSGVIGLFREDLLAAGLDDGYLGFRFAVTFDRPSDCGRVVVALANSQAVLLQQGATVTNQGSSMEPSSFICGALPDIAQSQWLKTRGILRESDVDLINTLDRFGVASDPVDYNLVVEHLKYIFESIALGPVGVDYVDLASNQDIQPALAALEQASDAGLFVLVADRRVTFLVQETGTADTVPAASDEVLGGVEYVSDRRSALFIRRWTPFVVRRLLSTSSVRCYFPVLAQTQSAQGSAGDELNVKRR